MQFVASKHCKCRHLLRSSGTSACTWSGVFVLRVARFASYAPGTTVDVLLAGFVGIGGRACAVRGAALLVGVNTDMAGELVRSTELLAAAWVATCVWLLACVCSDVSCLMFQTIESSRTQRAFVWPRNLRLVDLTVVRGGGGSGCS